MAADAGAGRARLLVVDDSRLMRKAAVKMLGEEFDLVTGDDGMDAWAMIEADHGIQVVFTDLNMPRMDGYELLQKIRAAEDPGIQGLPVIVVTGAENDEAARMKALDQGATDFISKPFTASDLIARARAHATYQRVTRQLQAAITLDPLTGLANRPGFLERLQQDIAYARRHHQPLSLVQIEVDDFRRFFLHYGREAADALTTYIAERLRARIRKEDTGARIGLGSFALSLPGGQEAGIIALVDWLCADLAENPPVVEGEPRPVTLLTAVMSPTLDPAMGAMEALEAIATRLHPAAPRSAEAASAPEPAVASAVSAADVPPPGAPPPAPPGQAAFEAHASGPSPTVPPPSTAPSVPAPAPVVAPAAEPAAPVLPADAVRIDEVLEQIRLGQVQELLPRMPQIIGRILPLLRLLGPRQRAQLIQFLQK